MASGQTNSNSFLEPLLGADESSFEQRQDRPVPRISSASSYSFNDGNIDDEEHASVHHHRLYQSMWNSYRDEGGTCVQRLLRKLRAHWNSLRTPNREEGLDFDTSENKLYSQRVEELTQVSASGGVLQNVEAVRWLTGLVIAIIVGCLAIIVDVSVTALAGHKFSEVNYRLDHEKAPRAFLYYAGYNMLFVSIATAFVAFLDLKAKGSGIPEIKSYLNGRKIHRVISIRTLVSKLVGVVFSVSGSLVLGKEGPMMHAGAVVGAIISQGRDEFYSFGLGILSFRSDKEKRSFVSLGCACGVAAAFSAPLGGVLFVIEEAASYWSVRLTWLTFFATMACASFVDVVLSGAKDTAEWGLMSQSAVVSFGSFEGASRDPCYPMQPPYRFMQLPLFVLIGAMGGLLGAAFNSLNLVLSRIRTKYIVDPRVRLVESLIVALISSTVFFGLSYAYPCRSRKDVHYASWTNSNPVHPVKNSTCELIAMNGHMCDGDDEVNDLETLMLSSLDSAVRRLFHSEALYAWPALLLFGFTVWMLACFTYGTSIPSGLFVPAITIGAALGRAFGQGLWSVDNGSFMNIFGIIDPGTYSLLGGAAMLGGVTRMTISIVVILMETTNNSTYAIPLMVTIMSAKVVGDLFTDGLYDMHIELQGIKFVHDQPPPNAHKIRVRDIMVKQPVVFNLFERVGDILQVLQDCSHNGFPVVSHISIAHHNRRSSVDIDSTASLHRTTSENSTEMADRLIRPPTLGEQRRFVSHRSLGSRSDLDATLFRTGSEQKSTSNKSTRRRNVKGRKRRANSQRTNLDADEVDEVRGKGIFEGTILRSELLILLFERVFVDNNASFQDRMKRKGATIAWRDFFKHYPRSPSIRDVLTRLSEEDFDRVVDLRPYLNSSALTVHHSVYVSRVHQLFRHLGLRHLTVVNTSNLVVGIITRHQLHELEHQQTPIVVPADAPEDDAEGNEQQNTNGESPDIEAQQRSFNRLRSFGSGQSNQTPSPAPTAATFTPRTLIHDHFDLREEDDNGSRSTRRTTNPFLSYSAGQDHNSNFDDTDDYNNNDDQDNDENDANNINDDDSHDDDEYDYDDNDEQAGGLIEGAENDSDESRSERAAVLPPHVRDKNSWRSLTSKRTPPNT